MKKYYNLGELLIDYRHFNGVSQSEVASQLDVDIRTVIRWEKGESLLNPEKEKALADITFIPYQVIRNSNLNCEDTLLLLILLILTMLRVLLIVCETVII